MGGGLELLLVDVDGGVEVLFNPAALVEEVVDEARDFGLTAAGGGDIGLAEAEGVEYVDDVLPFIGEIVAEDGGGVLPFVDFVAIADGLGQVVGRHRQTI